VAYSLILSLTYRLVLRAVEGKLSSVRGFLAIYVGAVYAPIIAFLAGASPYISLLVLAVSAIFLYLIISSRDPLSVRVARAGIGFLDLSMGSSAVVSALLLALGALGGDI